MSVMWIAVSVVALNFGAGGIGWWVFYGTRGDAWLRQRVGASFGVEIALTMRGHWHIERGGARGCLIEMIQLLGFMAAFMVWAVWMGFGVLLLTLITEGGG